MSVLDRLAPRPPFSLTLHPRCPPQTPLRAQPSQSYPSPPDTDLPAVRQGSVTFDPDATAVDIPQQHLPEQAEPAAPLMVLFELLQSLVPL